MRQRLPKRQCRPSSITDGNDTGVYSEYHEANPSSRGHPNRAGSSKNSTGVPAPADCNRQTGSSVSDGTAGLISFPGCGSYLTLARHCTPRRLDRHRTPSSPGGSSRSWTSGSAGIRSGVRPVTPSRRSYASGFPPTSQGSRPQWTGLTSDGTAYSSFHDVAMIMQVEGAGPRRSANLARGVCQPALEGFAVPTFLSDLPGSYVSITNFQITSLDGIATIKSVFMQCTPFSDADAQAKSTISHPHYPIAPEEVSPTQSSHHPADRYRRKLVPRERASPAQRIHSSRFGFRSEVEASSEITCVQRRGGKWRARGFAAMGVVRYVAGDEVLTVRAEEGGGWGMQ